METMPVKLFMHSFYASKTLSASKTPSKPPRGYARKSLCKFITFLEENSDITPDSIMVLEASGTVQGSKSNLVDLYRRMGFKIIGIEREGPTQASEYCEGDIPEDSVFGPGRVILMGCRMSDLKQYCKSRKSRKSRKKKKKHAKKKKTHKRPK